MTYKALLFQAPEFIDDVLIPHHPLCSAGFPPPSSQPLRFITFFLVGHPGKGLRVTERVLVTQLWTCLLLRYPNIILKTHFYRLHVSNFFTFLAFFRNRLKINLNFVLPVRAEKVFGLVCFLTEVGFLT